MNTQQIKPTADIRQSATGTLVAVACLSVLTPLPASGVDGLVEEKPANGRFVKTECGYMVPYQARIPGTKVRFWMEPIPPGQFLMGSPDSEFGRASIEGPRRVWNVEPFWMGRCETTQAAYRPFMSLYEAFKESEKKGVRVVTPQNRVDAVTAPTPIYALAHTFEFGEGEKLPVVTVTQYAAKQYSKWLSLLSGHQYRLPTEPEWEYACRAGCDGAWHFGDNPGQLKMYAWFSSNTNGAGYREVGTKMPNAWGLHDMHGNVAEWVLGHCSKYQPGNSVRNAASDWVRTDKLSGRPIRGGSWEFNAWRCRSASRLASDMEALRDQDANIPRSPWWLTSDPARGIGFRLVRPLKEVSRKKMAEYWEIDNQDTKFDVEDRLAEGRGVLGLVDRPPTNAGAQN